MAGQTAFNNFIGPYIQRYGFLQNGIRNGGGRVEGSADITQNDFYRQSIQGSYDFQLGNHNLHVGYQWYLDEEDLLRTSNGWGTITIPGGRINCLANSTCAGQQVFFQAQIQQQGVLDVPTIHSEYESQNFEINDEIHFGDFTANIGLLMSNDELFGQGLRENSSNVSGFQLDRNSQYKMYEVKWEDTLQPRLGLTWAYSGANTAYVNIARYVPAASSLPRAASWARNSAALINAYFDATGNFIGSSPESASPASSSPTTSTRAPPTNTCSAPPGNCGGWSARAHARYR